MLQKISLILLCGLVAIPTQLLYAENVCRSLFIEKFEESNPVQSNLESLTIHYIKQVETGRTFKIERNSSDIVELNREARTIHGLLTKNVPALLIKTRAIFEYSPKIPFERIADGISEVQLALLDARGRTASQEALAKDGAQNLMEKIKDEISEIKRKIIEIENLAYELDMITDLVGQLPSNFQNNISIHSSLLKTSLSKITLLKIELSNIEALKQDLILVIETQALKPTELSKKFYDVTEAPIQANDNSPISKVNVAVPAQKPTREFIPQENHTRGTIAVAKPAQRYPRPLLPGEQISRETTPVPPFKPNRVTSIPGRHPRVTVPVPTYTQMIGTKAGTPAIRSTEYRNPVNLSRSGVYVAQSGVTAKVDLNHHSRNMILNLKYESYSKNFPAKDILEQLRSWAQKYNIQHQIIFSHSGRIEDPILVTVKIKDKGMEQFYLQKLKDDFASSNPALSENLTPPTRIEPKPPKAAEPRKPLTLMQSVMGVLNHTPGLD
ncbi:MAG: hypothetical protein V4596_00565 [Bdellovibrionota bacterium]